MKIPKAFISYSHDSIEHKKWVLDLATRMRQANGIDVILDQWELTAGDDLPHFMEQNLAAADYVLMICTERYVEKANEGKGGVGYEKMIITSNLMSTINESKIIPVIKQTVTHHVPTFLKSKLFIDFSKKDDFEYSYDDLVRKIHQAPLIVKPEIGNNPFSKEANAPIQPSNDPMIQLIQIFVDGYETNGQAIEKDTIRIKLNSSRIMSDLLIKKAFDMGLLNQLRNYRDYYILSDAGKIYAVENGLIK